MPSSKVAAIRAFIADLAALRADAKADAVAMIERVPLSVLSDPEQLSEYLSELLLAVAEKHLMQGGRVRPRATRMIKQYVKGMVKR